MGNYSKQRQKIIDIIEQMNKVPTAEEIYYKVIQFDATISKSTVYRNLSFLEKNRNLIKIPILDGPDRYFYKKDDSDYGFVICQKCGKIQEFLIDFDWSIFQDNISKQTGARVLKEDMLIKGICEECILK